MSLKNSSKWNIIFTNSIHFFHHLIINQFSLVMYSNVEPKFDVLLLVEGMQRNDEGNKMNMHD
jgi:hypothetical protein